ncbi:hypothetical protein [Nocardia sp. NPDC127526]|uniref:hypothetical protein n=1 Tax=Nocardia sp. NPDC127526 TaxID=3345393 RepID=UPI003638285B
MGQNLAEHRKPTVRRPPVWAWWALAVALAVLAAALITVLSLSEPGDTEPTTPGTSLIAPDDTTPLAAVWNVPPAFLGEWTGTAAGHDIVLTINPGKNSEEIARTLESDARSGLRCEWVDRVITITADKLTFSGRLVGGAACGDDGRRMAITLRPDGSAEYTAPTPAGEAVTGTLRKN